MLRLALALSSILVVLGHLAAIPALGQGSGDIREMKLRDWEPRSMLVTKATTVPKAKFPVIDVHNHLGGGKATLTPQRVAKYLEVMDSTGLQTVVNLDGGWDERLMETLAALDNAHPGRFLTFRAHQLRRDRRARLDRARAQAAGVGVQGRGEGAEDPQEPGAGPSRQLGPADRGG